MAKKRLSKADKDTIEAAIIEFARHKPNTPTLIAGMWSDEDRIIHIRTTFCKGRGGAGHCYEAKIVNGEWIVERVGAWRS